MKRIVILLLTVFVFCENMFPQNTYNKILNFNRNSNFLFASITPVNEDLLIVCGTDSLVDSNRKRCSLVAKLDDEGNILNRNYILDSVYDVYEGQVPATSFFLTTSDTYKYAFDGENKKFILCEFDSTMQVVQRVDKEYNNSSFYQNTLNNIFLQSNVFVTGQIIDHTETMCWGNVLKLDTLGNVLQELIVPSESSIASAVQIKRTYDNALIISGDENFLTQVIKIDTSLNIIWQRTFGREGWNNNSYKCISLSPDSCYVVSGHYPVCASHHSIHGAEEYASCVRKIDDNGNLLWEKIIKNYNYQPSIFSNEQYWDVYVDDEGYIYYVGNGMNFDGYAGFLTKLSPNGDIMYRRSYTPMGNHNDYLAKLTCIKPTADGGLIMGGTTSDSYYGQFFNGYYQQPWLIKTDKDGLDGLCYTELPELDFDVFIPDTVCNMEQINCVVNISGPSAPYTLEFSTGQVIDSIYYPDVFVKKSTGIDVLLASSGMYDYTEYITEATLKDTAENIIARHYNIATHTLSGEQQLAITLTDFYGNTKTIYKDLYVNPCHEVEVDENENVVLSVYPNPATEYINIAGENIAEIQICNLLGGVVYETQQCNGNNVISTDGMGAGSYFVRVRMTDGKVVTKKIVVVE
ncbi:MAG: T9SS type A sorting domain-containing protein [Bacteroidales bacterium]|nr:T9SS type A sorting domain-containing protein [Bacteroidales bacterium]